MNTFANSPDLALTLAHSTITDRVHQAQQRAQIHAVRAERRAGKHTARWTSELSTTTARWRPPTWWTSRFAPSAQ